MKKIVSILLSLALCLGMYPTAALAATAEANPTLDVSRGRIYLTDGKYAQVRADDTNSNDWHDYTGTVTITGSSGAAYASIDVLRGDHAIILDNANLTATRNDGAGFAGLRIGNNANVTLTLRGDNTIKGSQIYTNQTSSQPGIEITSNSSLTIRGDGSLRAVGGNTMTTKSGKANVGISVIGNLKILGGARVAAIGGNQGVTTGAQQGNGMYVSSDLDASVLVENSHLSLEGVQPYDSNRPLVLNGTNTTLEAHTTYVSDVTIPCRFEGIGSGYYGVLNDKTKIDTTSGNGTLSYRTNATFRFSNQTYSLEVEDGASLGSFQPGKTVNLSAGAAPEGTNFLFWKLVSGEGSFADVNSESTTFTTGWQDTVVKPVFGKGEAHGDFVVERLEGDGEVSGDNPLTINGNGTYSISMKEGVEVTQNRIKISGGSPTVILNNVKIHANGSGVDASPVRVESSAGNVEFKLNGVNEIKYTGSYSGIPALQVLKNGNRVVTITSLAGDGSTQGTLIASSTTSAGIGMRSTGTEGAYAKLAIKGGTLNVSGSGNVPAICHGHKDGGGLDIYGGDITSNSSSSVLPEKTNIHGDAAIQCGNEYLDKSKISGKKPLHVYYDGSTGSSVKSLSVTPASASLTCGESLDFAAQIDAGVYADKTITWSVEGASEGTAIDSSGRLTVSEAQTPGTLTVKATNEYSGKTATATVTVTKRPAEVSQWPAAGEIVYGQALSDAVLTGGVADVEGSFAWVDGGQKPEVGTHFFEVIFHPDDAYTPPATGEVSVTVKPAVPVITWGSGEQSVSYTGSPAEITAPTVTLVDGEEYNGEITYSYAAENSENYKEGLPVDAGVNWVKASVPAQGNYAAAQSGDMKLTITKSIPAITLKNTYALSREYTGEAVPNPTADQMEITGAVYDNVEFSWDQEPVDAGTYTLTMKILATKNTEETVLAKTVTVTPKTVTAPVLRITPDSYEYTGSPIVPEKVEVLDGDIVIPESEYSFRYENNTQVGQATVTVTDNEGGNYTVSGEGSFAITKPSLASAEVALEESSFVYDKTQHKPAPTVLKNGRTLTANTDYTVSYENNINAGEATVTVTGMGNYSGEKIVYFTITPKELTPSITGTTTKTYDGTTAAPAGLSITLDGREGDDDVTATAANYAYNSPNVNGATTITASGITLSGTAAGNYKLSSDTAKIAGTITKDTSATAPAAGEGYTLDYTQETIAIEQGYEVSTAETDGTAVTGSITAYLGGKLYIRKIEDSNHAASGWTEFTLAARPQAPTLDATGETLLGQKDGLVSGVDTDMEYSTDGGSTWTACIGAEITGLGGCTVLVRVKATATAPHGEVSVCTIGEGRPITVTFDRQDGSSVETQTNRSYGEKLVKPEAPTREDYAFQGWYKESDCTTAWDFANDTLTAENVTLYAKWRKVRFKVGGTVKDSDGNTVVGGATVTLMKGSEQLDQGTTDENGGFTFSQHIEAGAYNIVTTYTPENGSPRIKTTLIALTDSDKEDVAVTLPPEGVNSTLTVSTGSNTPAVVVGGLDEEAAALKAQETTAATVTVSMEVEGKSESQVGTTVAEAIKEKAKGDSSSGEPMVEYLDISVTKQVDETKEQLTETKNVIEIVVPFDFTGKEAIVVVRYHGDSAEKFAEASDGEKLDKTYKLDKENGYIYIYASKFSTYAVGYTAAHTITFNANGGTVGKNSDTTGSNGKLSALPTPTRDGYTFLGWYTSPDGGTVVTTGTAFTGSTTIYAHWEKKSSQGGGGSGSGGGWYPTVSYYSVKVNKSENGTVTASPTSIYSGGTVTLTVKPDEGYKLDKITVTDSQGKAVELTEKGGKYTFKMPSRDVTVKAEFAPVQTATPSPGPTGSPSPSPSGSPTLSPSPRPWKNPFPDVKEGQWYIKAIEYVCTNGLMAGYSNGKFGLNDTLTRAQFAQIIYNKEGRPQASGGKFTDVTTGWYADAVNWAASEGIVAGVGGGRFAPDQPITRQDLAVMLWRYAGNPEPEKNELDFHDAEKVSGYAWKALCWANEKGIVNGKGGGILDPKGNATRAQAAQMLMKYLSE